MDLVKKIEIADPPTKWVKVAKTKIDPKTGVLKLDTYYLTANIFYAGHLHYAVKSQIVNFSKNFLMPHMNNIPKLEKCRLKITYQRMDEGFDLDNKIYYWAKLFIDILKIPSDKQVINAFKKGYGVKTVNVLPDDTVRYLDEINMRYTKGKHMLIFEIYGRKTAEQQKLL